MRVLNLVTNDDARFYQQQVAALEARGVEAETLPVPGSRDGTDRRSLSAYLRHYPRVLARSFGDYDLVHANYGLTAPAALAQPNLPVVVSLWGSDLMGTYGRVCRWCARQADAVVVMSEEMAARLDRPCRVVPHGVDLDLFEPRPRATARATLGWPDDRYHVLFPYDPGREIKDFPRARRVVGRVRDRVDAPVSIQTVAGEPHDRMPLYLNAADALLLTSRREGSPNVVKEAMACNLPVVSTDVGDVAERLAGVEPSAVCRSDEALVATLAGVLRRGERSDGREAARDLTLDRMARRLEAVYDSVLGSGRVADATECSA